MDVECVPLSVMWEGEFHNHFSNEKNLKKFYEKMRQGLVATTAALNPDNWFQAMEKHLRKGRDLLVLTVSSGISATYQSAMIAAEELRGKYPYQEIQVVDSLGGSLGEGLLLWHACRLRDAGINILKNVQWLREHSCRVWHWVTVDDLNPLKRSGRLSSASAFVGTMLNIKPIICVNEDGKLISNTKVRGRTESLQMLAKKFAEHRSFAEEELVTIAHGDCLQDAALLADLLKNEYNVKHIITGYVGPILGAHTGPGVLGLFHIGTQR